MLLEAIKDHVRDSKGGAAHLAIRCGISTVAQSPWTGHSEVRLLGRAIEVIQEGPARNPDWWRVHPGPGGSNTRLLPVHFGPSPSPGPYPGLHEGAGMDQILLLRLGVGEGDLLDGDIVHADGAIHPIQGIRVVGGVVKLFFPGRYENASEPFLARQALAFGHALNNELSHLRFGIVGCGGTGSAVAMLLTRLGAGSLFLVDEDTVSLTNLNRLHGARREDAERRLPKVEVIARECLRLELGTRVQTFQGWVNSASAIDGLKACDVIFSCTDDHMGRALLSKFAYFYCTPVIDMGLAIELDPGTPGQLRVLEGRVSLLAPGGPCLLCSKVISMEKARAEALRRSNPIEYERQKAEAYVIGEGNPNPAVVTFTTEVATMAVNHLLQLMTGFRGNTPAPRQTTRRFDLEDDFHPGFKPGEHCRICGAHMYWGTGDMDPFLNGNW